MPQKQKFLIIVFYFYVCHLFKYVVCHGTMTYHQQYYNNNTHLNNHPNITNRIYHTCCGYKIFSQNINNKNGWIQWLCTSTGKRINVEYIMLDSFRNYIIFNIITPSTILQLLPTSIATNKNNFITTGRNNAIYYLGLIEFLQPYDFKKYVEYRMSNQKRNHTFTSHHQSMDDDLYPFCKNILRHSRFIYYIWNVI
jgi:hypothetical protein